MRALRRYPFAVLLTAQLAALLVYPFLDDGGLRRELFSALGIVIVVLVVLAVRASPALTWVSVLLGVPATMLLLTQAVTGSNGLVPYTSALEAVLYFYAAGALIAYMLSHRDISRETLFALGATFTLVAWAFADAYTVWQAIEPGSFSAANEARGERSWMDLLMLSFSTLTMVGLGDVVPIQAFARALVMIEELVGLSYIAALVSRLVGLSVRGRRNGRIAAN